MFSHQKEFVSKHDSDKAGDFLAWLYKSNEVYAHPTTDRWFDIGSLDQLEKAKEEFNG